MPGQLKPCCSSINYLYMGRKLHLLQLLGDVDTHTFIREELITHP